MGTQPPERGFDAGPLPSETAGGNRGGRERQSPGGPDGILARQRIGPMSMGGVVRQRRVLPWGALSDRELMDTARQRARQPSGVDAPPGWWVAAQVLYGWVVVPDGDPHGVLTGAVAAQVVAADLRALVFGARRPALGGGGDRGGGCRGVPPCGAAAPGWVAVAACGDRGRRGGSGSRAGGGGRGGPDRPHTTGAPAGGAEPDRPVGCRPSPLQPGAGLGVGAGVRPDVAGGPR